MTVEEPAPIGRTGSEHAVGLQILALQLTPTPHALTPELGERNALRTRVALLRRLLSGPVSHRLRSGKLCLGLADTLIRMEVLLEVILDVEDLVNGVPPPLAVLLPVFYAPPKPRWRDRRAPRKEGDLGQLDAPLGASAAGTNTLRKVGVCKLLR